MKKIMAMILSLFMLLPASGLAEGSTSWLYSFSAGEALSGEGMEKVRDFLDAMQVRLTTENRENQDLGEAALISYGKPVFYLRAASDAKDGFGLYCSLMGECTLNCQKDQVNDFLLTLVQMLGDLSVLKQDSLAQAQNLAQRAGAMIMVMTNGEGEANPTLFMDLNFYLQQASQLSTQAQTDILDADNAECPGAVVKCTWLLSEEDLNALVDVGIGKLKRIPVVSEAFVEGRMKIGSQPVDEAFLHQLTGSLHGETTLVVYLNEQGEAVQMSLYTPDLSNVISDPAFEQVHGIELKVENQDTADREISLTSLRLIGMEEGLLSVKTEKYAGDSIPDLPTKKVYQVGEMNSTELWNLIRSLGLTIAGNAINLVMDLPRIVFDTLIDHIF